MPQPFSPVVAPPSPTLSASQLAILRELGEERTAEVWRGALSGGRSRLPFIAIIAGEVAILDGAGNEVIRHGAAGFLGESNLLSGQMMFVAGVATRPLRYIAVARDVLRTLLHPPGD
jgi:hypothetical protein